MQHRVPKLLHAALAYERRIAVLTDRLAACLPAEARVLDVGCGDGRIARRLMELRPDVSVRGIDTVVRADAAIPVDGFDGATIPHPDGSFDAGLLVDVLHHTDDPVAVLREVRRVVRRCIAIKDHLAEGAGSRALLRFMDRVGNSEQIHLPYNYWPLARWRAAFEELGLEVGSWEDVLHLYPAPFDWVFGRRLHFVARLDLA